MTRTNIDLDDELIKEGLSLTKCKSKRELVHVALEDLVNRKKRKKILELEGKVNWQGNLDVLRESRV